MPNSGLQNYRYYDIIATAIISALICARQEGEHLHSRIVRIEKDIMFEKHDIIATAIISAPIRARNLLYKELFL